MPGNKHYDTHRLKTKLLIAHLREICKDERQILQSMFRVLQKRSWSELNEMNQPQNSMSLRTQVCTSILTISIPESSLTISYGGKCSHIWRISSFICVNFFYCFKFGEANIFHTSWRRRRTSIVTLMLRSQSVAFISCYCSINCTYLQTHHLWWKRFCRAICQISVGSINQ